MRAMPGERMLALAQTWFAPDTVTRIFEPLIADYQAECASTTRMRCVRCRIDASAAFVLSFVVTFMRDLRSPLPLDLHRRAWLIGGAFTAAGVLFLAVAFHRSFTQGGAAFAWVLPSQIALGLPLALAPMTIILATRGTWLDFAVRRAVLRSAIAVTLVMLPLVGWVTPFANQSWRVAAFQKVTDSPILRGPRELSLSELASKEPPSDYARSAVRRRSHELHVRLGLILVPLPIAALGLAVGRVRKYGVVRAVFWWMVCGLAVGVFTTYRNAWLIRKGFPPLDGWLPHMILLALTIAMHATSPPRSGPTTSNSSGPAA